MRQRLDDPGSRRIPAFAPGPGPGPGYGAPVLPAGDPVLARLFCDMRGTLHWPIEAVAAHIATHPGVIAALEAGDVTRLPPWPETARVVMAYAQLLAIDPAAILQRLHHDLSARHQAIAGYREAAQLPTTRAAATGPYASQTPAAMTPRVQPATRPLPQAPGASPGAVPARDRPGRTFLTSAAAQASGLATGLANGLAARVAARVAGRRRLLRGLAMLVGVMLSGVGLWQWGGQVVHASVDLLPARLAKPVRSSLDRVTARVAPGSDGLRWIHVLDPRSRKTDKLTH